MIGALISSIISFWLVWAISQNSEKIRGLTNIPKLDASFDAIAAATAVGRLDVTGMILTFIGIIAALALIYGWTAFRTAATKAALEELQAQLPGEIRRLMDEDGHRFVAMALDDAEFVATLQERFTSTMIDDMEFADMVDDEPDWKEVSDDN